MQDERWLPVPGWPAYDVSSLGRVRRGGRILKPHQDRHGLLAVRLYDGPRRSWRNVHRLVAEAFHGPRPSPAHRAWILDGRRNRPHADNVAWLTLPERACHARAGLARRGPRLTAGQVREILAARGTFSAPELAEKYGCARATVLRIWRGADWRGVSRQGTSALLGVVLVRMGYSPR